MNAVFPVELLKDLDEKTVSENIPSSVTGKSFKTICKLILWTILKRSIQIKRKNDSLFVNVHNNRLHDISSRYFIYMKWLRDNDFIEVNDSYECRLRSKAYRINSKYKESRTTQATITCNPKVTVRMRKPRKDTSFSENKRLEMMTNAVSIDPFAAYRIIMYHSTWTPRQKEVFKYQVSEICDGNFHLFKSRTGREHGTLTNLPRCLRDIIKINGDYIKEIDIVACQPTMLAKWIKGRVPETEYLKFKLAINEKRFYEQIQFEWERSYDTKITRDEAKLVVFKVFNDIERPKPKKATKTNWHYQQLFKRLYPSIYQVMQDVLKSGRTMASILQKMESDYIFETVTPDLSTDYFTVHDAVYIADTVENEHINDSLYESLYQGA